MSTTSSAQASTLSPVDNCADQLSPDVTEVTRVDGFERACPVDPRGPGDRPRVGAAGGGERGIGSQVRGRCGRDGSGREPGTANPGSDHPGPGRPAAVPGSAGAPAAPAGDPVRVPLDPTDSTPAAATPAAATRAAATPARRDPARRDPARSCRRVR